MTLDSELSLTVGEKVDYDIKSIDGLFEVILWKLDDKITLKEFQQIYGEWLKMRKISSVLEAKSMPHESSLHSQTYLVSLFVKHSREEQMLELLPRMLLTLKDEFNRFISQYTGDGNYLWCMSLERIFELL